MENVEISDDQIVKVIVKMRHKLAAMGREHDAAVDVIKEQRKQLEVELLKRLRARGSTQTKTPHGTAFIENDVKVTIADELQFFGFLLETKDLDFLQKRVAVGHLQKWQKLNEGRVPPGLSTFTEAGITVRSPTK